MGNHNPLKKKLAESDLTLQDAELLGMRLLTPKETGTLAKHYRDQVAIFIPYFDVTGKPMDFHRVRYLEDLGPFEQGRKYDGPSGHPPKAYFPRLTDWKKVAKYPQNGVVITEGEFKAACACKKGIIAIGLGGVWNWRSKALGMEFLPELEAFVWKDRAVDLCFDSDVVVKPQVRQALILLARELAKRGAEVKQINLPQQGEEKVGLDDFLVTKGIEAFRRLERTPIHGVEAKRRAFNERYVYLDARDWVFDTEGQTLFYNRQHFLNATGPDRYLDPLSGKERSMGVEWYKAPERLVLPGFVFAPGVAQQLITKGEKRGVNIWKGWPLAPRRGSVEPMLRVVDFVVGTGVERKPFRDWLLRWLAYPLQHPGAKLDSCVFVFGREQGVGKSSIGIVMNDIYGAHGKALMEDDFFGNWNSWIETALFAVCDELSFDGSRKSRSVFKRYITAEELELQKKYQQQVKVENHCNFYFTSNSAGGLPLEHASNRRVLVLKVQGHLTPEWTKFMTGEFDTWRDKRGTKEGVKHWLHYLLHQVDCTGWEPNQVAPSTPEESEAIQASGAVLELWLTDAVNRMPLDRSDVWSLHDLTEVYQGQTGDHRRDKAAMTRALGQLEGAVKLKALRDGGRVEGSLWAIRNAEKWRKAKPKEILAEWQKSRFQGAPGVGD